MRALRLAFLALGVACAMPASLALLERPAAAAEQPDAFARIVVDQTELRSGPGVSFRSVVTAHRGDTFALDGRQGGGYWLRVLLEDGRPAYVVGEHVQPFAVRETDEKKPPRPGLFAPPPLQGAHAGFALLGGVFNAPDKDNKFQQYGYLEIRPQVVLHPTFAIEGFFGDGLTADGAQLVYGGGPSVYLFPSWFVCPFMSVAGGGISVFPNEGNFVLTREDKFLLRAGGGLMLALRWRILVRLEVDNLTIFASDSYKNAQIFMGGLGVYF
jgi:hypothetical protein